MVAERSTSSAPYRVSFGMNPVRMADFGCDNAGVCGDYAGRVLPAVVQGVVHDTSYRTDPDEALAMRGFDLAANTEWVSSPLELDWDTNTIVLDVANAHREPVAEGGEVFDGRVEFRLPNTMLRVMHRVDDPASLTASAFSVSGAGGAATTDVTVAPESVHVVIDGMRFSKRTLKIQGKTWPRKPRQLAAVRKSAVRGVIRSEGARSRGSKVRGYQAVCRSAGGHVVRKATKPKRKLPIRIKGLEPRTKYTCKVRAKSKAGLGAPAAVTMPRRP